MNPRATLGLLAVLCVAAGATWLARADHTLLLSEAGASWIRHDEPFVLRPYVIGPVVASYRHSFEVPEDGAVGPAALEVRALRSFRLSVNGHSLEVPPGNPRPWRIAERFDLAPLLTPGENQLEIEVVNDRGPPVLWVRSEELGIGTDASWESTRDEAPWQLVALASERPRAALASQFPNPLTALGSTALEWLVWFALGAGAAAALGSRRAVGLPAIRPGTIRLLLLAVWVALAINNLTQIPVGTGGDVDAHYAYVRHVANKHRLPLANEGWQAFQPPLFYIVAAPVFRVARVLGDVETAKLALRAFTLLCGIGLLEMTYRAARRVFPSDDRAQTLALATGGVLPMSVYSTHFVSNEPFAALLTAALVVSCVSILGGTSERPLPRTAQWLGLLFGLAILSKVTVILLAPLLIGVLVWAAVLRAGSARAAVEPVVRFGLVTGVVSGWYFLRNWLALGKPWVGGWDPERGWTWWQYPGYRVPADFLSFGEALVSPLYSAFASLWDGIYTTVWLDGVASWMVTRRGVPPWSYDHVLAASILALPLTLALGVGVVRSVRAWRTRPALLFCSLSLGIYLAALTVLFLLLPVYSTAKGTYTLGLAPCYGILIAWGLDALPGDRITRAGVAGYLVAWLAFVFRAYWI